MKYDIKVYLKYDNIILHYDDATRCDYLDNMFMVEKRTDGELERQFIPILNITRIIVKKKN